MLETMLTTQYPDVSIEKITMYEKIALDKLKIYFNEVLNISITEEEIEREYISALFLLISNALDFESVKGLKSIKQGNKSISYNTYENKLFVLTDEIKSLLPLPVVKFWG